MKTLIVHPPDPTTGFIKPAYEGFECTLIEIASASAIRRAIMAHDRIICMGHGTPLGLLNQHQKGFTVDSRMVQALRPKLCHLIWCHANEFTKKYHLNGYSCGMIISEPSEADYLGIPNRPGDIEASNEALIAALKPLIWENQIGQYLAINPLMEYNRQNLYL